MMAINVVTGADNICGWLVSQTLPVFYILPLPLILL